MPMAQRQGRECADCLGNRRLEHRLFLRHVKERAFHGRSKPLDRRRNAATRASMRPAVPATALSDSMEIVSIFCNLTRFTLACNTSVLCCLFQLSSIALLIEC